MDENERIPAILIITGPTASGKSSLAESLAMRYSLPIISADSRQIYRKFDIGTAKPTTEIRSKIQYEMIDILNPEQRFSAGKFAIKAADLIDRKYRNESIIILAGGTGFYIQALINGLADIPEIVPSIDQKWNEMLKNDGIESLQKELEHLDPLFMEKGDFHNPHRILRAAKVAEQTGQSIYNYQPVSLLSRDHIIGYFALHHERKILYDRINERVDVMIEQGLVEEVRGLMSHQNCPAMQSVGYKEFIPYFENKSSLQETTDIIKQHSRNFAKRQLTWLRKHGDWNWISVEDENRVTKWVEHQLGISSSKSHQ